MAAIEYRGANAVTNFDISRYIDKLRKKGIPVDNLLQLQPQCPLPTSPPEHSELEVEQQPPPPPPPAEPPQKHLELQDQQAERLQCQLPCLDTSNDMILNSLRGPMEDHEMTWSFCLDSELGQPLAAEMSLGSECDQLPDLFYNSGFEENIDLIFDACPLAYGNNPETASESTCGIGEVGAPRIMEEGNGKEEGLLMLSSFSSSSPCSTTTSVSCDYFV